METGNEVLNSQLSTYWLHIGHVASRPAWSWEIAENYNLLDQSKLCQRQPPALWVGKRTNGNTLNVPPKTYYGLIYSHWY
jgi:hypothetical protein